ncbi:MAG: PEP-CTERM sorting domain-containing protein [Opitutaceae bacterium]
MLKILYSFFPHAALFFVSFAIVTPSWALLLASNFSEDSLIRFDDATGEVFIAPSLGGLSLPHRSRIAPDGSLLVASAGSDNLLRYNLEDGSYLGEFVSSAGGLDYPTDLVFRQDGFLYVSSQLSNEILRFDSITGTRDLSWSASHGDLVGPSGFVFDENDNIYVSGRFSNNVVQFSGDGSFMRSFGNVPTAFGMIFGASGNLLVASGGNGTIEAFSDLDAMPSQGIWASGLSTPVGIDSDGSGGYYVAEFGAASITQLDADGSSLSTFASGAPLNGPNFISVVPEPSALAALLGVLSLLVACRRRTH